MPTSAKILFAGESWMTHSIHVKGFDSFENSSYHEGGTEMIAALRAGGFEVTYQPSHIAANEFPFTKDEIDGFDLVILSDIGTNTLLLPDRTAVRSEPTPNRLQLIRDFVLDGGGLLMVGGYLTFQGIQAKGNYKGSPVEEVLPVEFYASDDRNEQPQGVLPTLVDADHAVVAGLANWPKFLGYNRSKLRADAHAIAMFGDDPFIAVRKAGKGRSAVFASDCGPHWGPPEFVNWSGYGRLWTNLAGWLAGQDRSS
ncbi:MAG: hypothetical protein QOK29_3721 [Rhodospirillaceae bacterium]|jgi:uncharacterized membrane protein|nr:hypothetical protein [Rhodospirillaceae bacterium]